MLAPEVLAGNGQYGKVIRTGAGWRVTCAGAFEAVGVGQIWASSIGKGIWLMFNHSNSAVSLWACLGDLRRGIDCIPESI